MPPPRLAAQSAHMSRRQRLRDRIRLPGTSPRAALLPGLILLAGFIATIATISDGDLLDFSGRSRRARANATPEPLTLRVTADHRYFWADRGPYPLDGFADRFADWRKKFARSQVRIVTETSAQPADAAALADEIRRQGAAVSIEPANTH